MNIFVTSSDPAESARYLDDTRVNKMILESVQILCTALSLKGIETPVKQTHINHPSAVWARATRQNYIWLCDHISALLDEKAARTGKEHSYRQHLNFIRDHATAIPSLFLTPFANCAARSDIGIRFHHVKDTPLAYRLYLLERWKLDKRQPKRYGQPIDLQAISENLKNI